MLLSFSNFNVFGPDFNNSGFLWIKADKNSLNFFEAWESIINFISTTTKTQTRIFIGLRDQVPALIENYIIQRHFGRDDIHQTGRKIPENKAEII
ncbi:MAG TPA: hypothetical protein VGO45_13840 [Bacteroidia bacterium]|jgi:hypothetical protein|nr:hypothetical protein [Bacteroidia bacterium]